MACSRLLDSGEDAKEKVREKLAFYFRVCAFSISGPNYLGAWNRLVAAWLHSHVAVPALSCETTFCVAVTLTLQTTK